MNERKATVALLTVTAVLLALNLVVKGTGTVEAQVRSRDGEPYVVKYVPGHSDYYYRVWSDGQIDAWSRPDLFECEWTFDGVPFPPVGHPFEVVAAESVVGGITVSYADGRVDFADTSHLVRCTIAGEGSTPFCIGDTDRSGVTDFQDIINVLEDWGECTN